MVRYDADIHQGIDKYVIIDKIVEKHKTIGGLHFLKHRSNQWSQQNKFFKLASVKRFLFMRGLNRLSNCAQVAVLKKFEISKENKGIAIHCARHFGNLKLDLMPRKIITLNFMDRNLGRHKVA